MQNSDQSTFSWLGLSNRLSGQWSLDNPRVFHHIPDFCPVDGGQVSGFQVVSPHHHRIPTTDLLLQPLCLMDYATEFQDTGNPCTILMAGNLAKEMLWNVNVDYWILSYWWWYYLTLNMIILLYSFVAWLLLAADQPMHQYCLGLAECRHGLDSLILYYRTWHVTVKLFVLHTIQSMPSVEAWFLELSIAQLVNILTSALRKEERLLMKQLKMLATRTLSWKTAAVNWDNQLPITAPIFPC